MRAPKVSANAGRRVAAVSVAGLLAVGAAFFGSPASAQTIEVPIEDVSVTADPGTSVPLGSADVPADLQGRSCEIAAEVTNQASEHPGNTLVITSGDSKVEIQNIEDVAMAVTTGAGPLTLGATIEVSVLLGDSGTSLGSNLKVTCEPLPAPPPPPPVDKEPTYTG